jgi:hypothetical protein
MRGMITNPNENVSGLQNFVKGAVVIGAIILSIVWFRVFIMGHAIPAHRMGDTKTALGNLRVCIRLYKDDHRAPPTKLDELIPRYLQSIPSTGVYYEKGLLGWDWDSHPVTDHVRYVSILQADDAGGWVYVNDPHSPDFGKLIVNCTHQDFHGLRWDQQ